MDGYGESQGRCTYVDRCVCETRKDGDTGDPRGSLPKSTTTLSKSVV